MSGAVWYMFPNVSGKYTAYIFRTDGLGTGNYCRYTCNTDKKCYVVVIIIIIIIIM